MVVPQIITGVSRVPGHEQLVVVHLTDHDEHTVLRPVPVRPATGPQFQPQLVEAAHRQLMERLVADPVVAPGVVEPRLVLRPRTIERACSVDILLDQHREAVGLRHTFTHVALTLTVHVSLIIIIIIMVYFRQKPIEHNKAMNNKTERQTEYKRTETATERHTMK